VRRPLRAADDALQEQVSAGQISMRQQMPQPATGEQKEVMDSLE